jgi:hypothetical protein
MNRFKPIKTHIIFHFLRVIELDQEQNKEKFLMTHQNVSINSLDMNQTQNKILFSETKLKKKKEK